ncbi:tail fiber assembly protein [Variovorax sp. W6]|uniref:tail fiber assembly protein n=1 Tax=Variovorax sp. W6 TaxID=3093895 RepID=UPI003D8016A7
MTDYARIQTGLVMEVIAAYFTTEADRPKAPELEEGAELTEAQIEQQRLHEEFKPGEVPIERRFTPEILATLVAIPAGATVAQGDSYDGSDFGPPPQPPAPPPPTAAEVLAQRDALLSIAALRIAPLQDATDLDDATDAEKAALTAWKQYRVKLNRIEQQTGFPGTVQWPQVPV